MASEYKYDEDGETWPFFVLAILTFVLVPLTYKWVTRLLSSDDAIALNEKVPGALRKDHRAIHPVNEVHITKFYSKQKSARIFNKTLVVLVIGWALVIYISIYLTKEADLAGTFDPYTILDVSITASEREIKSKYRKLSLKFHPDKLPKDLTESVKEEMEAAFIKINLAYKALTDEVTKANFQKYGHPDGPQDVTHGIAIPRFLVEGKYSPVMILVYFLLIGVVLPFIVGRWWNNVKSHTRKGLHVETAGLFVRRLADRNPSKVVTPYDILDMMIISQEIKDKFPHLQVPQVKQHIAKHLFRKFDEPLDAKSEAERLAIVAELPALISGFIEIATVFRATEYVVVAADLHKAIIQAARPTGPYQELLQLPHVNADAISDQPVRKLGKLFAVSEEEAGKILGITDKQKLAEALEVAAHIPQLRVIDASFKVPGETVVPTSSNAHISVKFLVKGPRLKSCPEIEDERLQEEETLEYLKNPLSVNDSQPRLPFTYSPYFPGNIRNGWVGILVGQKDAKIVENSGLAYLDHADLSNLELSQEEWAEGKVTIGTFNIALPMPTPPNENKYHFRLILKNTGYFGCDVDIPLVMDVKTPPPPKLDAAKLKAKLEGKTDSDSESDISDPEEDSIAGALAALRGGAVKKRQEAEDDESDAESVFTDINTDTEDEKE